MTTRLTGPEKAACLSLLTTTFPKAFESLDAQDLDSFITLVDPDSQYPAPVVYAAVERVCQTYRGYSPKPGDVNDTLRDIAAAAVRDTTSQAPAPSGMSDVEYRHWLRKRHEKVLDDAFPPGPLLAAVQRSQEALGAFIAPPAPGGFASIGDGR